MMSLAFINIFHSGESLFFFLILGRLEFMGHLQFISLYRQEVTIDLLLRFFHRV